MSDFQEVPLFEVPATHERTPLPPIAVVVSVDVEVSVPGELLRSVMLPPEAGDDKIASMVYDLLMDGDREVLVTATEEALRAGWWKVKDITALQPANLWSWEWFAYEVQHPTWRPIEGTP